MELPGRAEATDTAVMTISNQTPNLLSVSVSMGEGSYLGHM
jgi:hypothetical protein